MSNTSRGIGRVVDRIRRTVAVQAACALPDHDLLQRYIASRDESAFAALVRRHGPMVLGLCLRVLRHRQDAEDAFQATFLVLARKAGSIRHGTALSSWLHRVALRAAGRLRALNGRRFGRQISLTEVAEQGHSEDPAGRETGRLLDEELNRLADKYRAPILLCCVQGRTRDEAARQLGLGLNVLRGRLDRGRELLRARLARRGVTLSGALLPLGVAGICEAAVLPELLAATVRAASITAPSSAAAVSAQAAALSQGVIHAMFLAKMKSVAFGLLALTFVGTGAGLVTYQVRAQDGPTARTTQQAPAAGPSPRAPTVADLQREIERLRLELEQARLLLQAANKEILKLRAARADREEANRAAAEAREKVLRDRDQRAARIDELEATREKVLRDRDQRAARIPEPRVGQQRADSLVDQGAASSGVLSPDKRLVAKADQKLIGLFDVETGREIRRFQGHTATVTALAFSPDGKVLVSGSQDKSVILWDPATGRQLSRLSLENAVATVTFMSDGRRLLIRTQNQRILVDATTGQIIRSTKP